MTNKELPILFRNDPYAKHFGDQYIKKMKYLEEVVTSHETGETNFLVLNFEGGLGKSFHLLKALNQYLSDPTWQRNVLVVKKFKAEIDKAVDYLSGQGQWSVLGITVDNWTNDWARKAGDLQDIRVLFITHDRYMKLCLNEKERQYFTENRHVVVIDEKVIFPVFTFKNSLYNLVRGAFNRSIQELYDRVCEPLRNWLDKFQDFKNQCFQVRAKIKHDLVTQFKSIVEANWSSIPKKMHEDVNYFLRGLDVWYGTVCVYNAGNISGVHPLHRHWGLANNLILDASASIDGVYKMNPRKFQIMNQGLVIDHEKCRFNVYKFNTSKSSIQRNEAELFPEIARKIKETLQPHEKLLIICHKNYAAKLLTHLRRVEIEDVLLHEKDVEYSGQQVVINWYGNIVGKNDYSKFQKCWLIGTPNLPFEQYLVHYQQYSFTGLGRKGMILHNGRFVNKKYKTVQVGYIAAEMYQALKRIQRVVEPEGEFNIVSNDPEVVKLVLHRFKNAVRREEFEFGFKERQEEEKEENRNKRVIELAKYLESLQKGVYSKREIRDAVGIDQAHFSDYLKNERIVRLEQNKIITITYRSIERL